MTVRDRRRPQRSSGSSSNPSAAVGTSRTTSSSDNDASTTAGRSRSRQLSIDSFFRPRPVATEQSPAGSDAAAAAPAVTAGTTPSIAVAASPEKGPSLIVGNGTARVAVSPPQSSTARERVLQLASPLQPSSPGNEVVEPDRERRRRRQQQQRGDEAAVPEEQEIDYSENEENQSDPYQHHEPTFVAQKKTKRQKTGISVVEAPATTKKKYQQLYLDFGQRDFAKRILCEICGMMYVHGVAEDIQQHQAICKDYVQGVPFCFAGGKEKNGGGGARVVSQVQMDSTKKNKKTGETKLFNKAETCISHIIEVRFECLNGDDILVYCLFDCFLDFNVVYLLLTTIFYFRHSALGFGSSYQPGNNRCDRRTATRSDGRLRRFERL